MTAGGIDDGVRAVVIAAEQQARGLGHHAIAPAHLLLGLIVEEADRAATVDGQATGAEGPTPWGSTLWGSTLWGSTLWGSTPLAWAGMALEEVRAAVVRHADADLVAKGRLGDHRLRGGWGSPVLPVTAQGRGVLQQALRRAAPPDEATTGRPDRQLVTVAHLLLGVLDHADTVTAQALAAIGVDTTDLSRTAEPLATSAPWLDTIRTAPRDRARIGVHTDDQGKTVFSTFGWPSWDWLKGPAVRRVLTQAEQTGKIDAHELQAAAENDAAHHAWECQPVLAPP